MKHLLLTVTVLLLLGVNLFADIDLTKYRDVVSGKETKIVLSEGFEGKSNPWNLTRGASFGREGSNGNGSLSFERKSINDPYVITQLPVKLSSGKKYRVQWEARFENMSPGKSGTMDFFAIEFFPGGKYAGGPHPVIKGVKEGDTPWQKFEETFEAPQSKYSDLRARIAIYIPSNISGRIIYDNILIEEIGESQPIVYLIAPKNLNVSESSKLRFRVENFGRGKDLLLHVVCGKVAATGKVINGEAVVKLPALPQGQNTLASYVLDPAQKIRYGKISCNVFNIPQEANGIKVRPDGGLERNGKPFLPVGIYVSEGKLKPADVKQIAEGGFNYVLPYCSTRLNIEGGKGLNRLQALQKSLDFLAKNNLMMCSIIKERQINKEIDGHKGDEAIKYLCDGIKNHPALMAWYVSDENPIGEIPEVVQLREQVSKNDPNHPVFTLTDKPHHAIIFGGTGDIFIGDPYPIYGNESRDMSRIRDFINTVNQDSAFHCWLAPQAFHWGAFQTRYPYSKNRYPTEQEMRSMVLLAMNLGSKGYAFYSHTPIFNQQEKLDPGSSKVFWPQVSNVAKLLRELEPFFFTKEVAPKVIVKNEDKNSKPLVEAKAYKANGKTVVVITSDGPGHANAILTIHGSRQYKSRYGFTRSLGNGKYRFEGDNICSDILESIE